MNAISWNCRGLGRPRAVQELTELVRKHSPLILFLMETKAKDSYVNNLKHKLQLDNVHIVSRQNTGGGLALFWKSEINLHVINALTSHIDAVVNPGMDDAWWFTGFYGNPVTANREHFWALLKHLNLKMELPWLCVGDFNEIVRNEEKMGRPLRRERQMMEFREALDYCSFRDLGFVGAPFTWCNNQYDGMVTWIRLDRAVATNTWIQFFPSTRVHHISGSLSDHCPLWICTDDENIRFYRKRRPFRFEAAWMKDEGCEGVIRNSWEGQSLSNPMERVVNKINRCSQSLQTWSKLSFGNIRRLLHQKKKLLVQAEKQSMGGSNHDQVRLLKAEVHDLMVKEECLWH